MTPKSEVNPVKTYKTATTELRTRLLGPKDLRSKCWRLDCHQPAELHCEEGADVFLLCFRCAGKYVERTSRGKQLALTVPVGKHEGMWLARADLFFHALFNMHRQVVARDAGGRVFALGCRDCGTYFWRRKS
jgi:hypothetical protein